MCILCIQSCLLVVVFVILFVTFSCSALRKVNEKKQMYSVYRLQKKKEESEQEQERLKKNKEEALLFLEDHELVHSETRYR